MHPAIAIPVTCAIVLRAWKKKSLTPAGCVVAGLTALAHAYHPWNLPFVLLLVFFLAGTRVTHIKEGIKAQLTLTSRGSSGGDGPRTHVQVLANSLVATVLTVMHAIQLRWRTAAFADPYETNPEGSICYSWGGDLLIVGIVANYAVVCADTFSSELGILSKSEPRLITSPTLRKVPRGTNGGVTLVGLGAGLLGALFIVTATMMFLPVCGLETISHPAGGPAWGVPERRVFMGFLIVWGGLGSVLDSVLGALFQRSVKDVRSGKIVEGEGGSRVLISASQHGNEVVDKSNAGEKQAETVVGDKRPSRAAESGWDLLDNNDVNFLMAVTMSVGAMSIAGWYWNVPISSVISL